jgi:hypothetical protein
MDERLIGGAIGEGIDDVCVRDIGEFVALLGEALNVLLEGLARPLLAITQIPRVTRSSWVPWKCSIKVEWRSAQL